MHSQVLFKLPQPTPSALIINASAKSGTTASIVASDGNPVTLDDKDPHQELCVLGDTDEEQQENKDVFLRALSSQGVPTSNPSSAGKVPWHELSSDAHAVNV